MPRLPERLESHVFSSYWDDGLLDVFAAVGILLVGICWLWNFPVGAAIVPALLAPLWAPLRQKFIEPRKGYVEFTDTRVRRNRWRLQIVAYLGVAALLLGIEAYFLGGRLTGLPFADWVAGLPAILLAVLAVLASLLTGSARFLVYAVLLTAAGIAGPVAGWLPASILLLAGSGSLAIATAILIRFLLGKPQSQEAGS